MSLKKIAAAAMAAIMTAALCGCDFNDLGSDGMLRPPKTMGDEAEIEQLISKSANKSGYILKYPKSGTHRSAIVFEDLDLDDGLEAVAFFRNKDDLTAVHMLIMRSNGGVWELSDDFVNETTDVDCVDFADVDGDGKKEILVGYTTYTPNVNVLSCYAFNEGNTEKIAAGQNYSAFYCGNLNSDKSEEIITLSLYSPENEAKAAMLSYDPGSGALIARASATMDPNVVKYKNVSFSDLGGGVKGVVVDGSFANEEINTEVIYYSEKMSLLRNPLFREKEKNPTQRSNSVLSADIDNDLTLEIPVIGSLPHLTENAETTPDKIIWNSFDAVAENLVPETSVIANYAYGYTIKMQKKWKLDSVTAIMRNDSGETDFYDWNGEGLGDKLFTVRAFDASEWDQGKNNEEYNLIYKDNKYAYTFINYKTESENSLTDNEIKTAFSILGDTAA